MFDTGAASPVAAPNVVANDTAVSKPGCLELWDAPITAIGENTSMIATPRLHG